MHIRNGFLSLAVTAALIIGTAGFATAEPPQLYGYVACYYAFDDQSQPPRSISNEDWWTRQEIAAFRRTPAADSCLNGTFTFVETDPPAA